MNKKLPFIQIDIPEDGSYKHPYIPAGFAGTEKECKEFLAKHENDNYKKKFPFCCQPHSLMYKDIKKGLNKIIAEKTYENRWWFKIENYENLPKKIPYQIFLTTYHIDYTYNKPDGFDDITEYIEYIVDSFGQPAIFADYYFYYLKQILKNSTGNEQEVEMYHNLLTHIEERYFTAKESTALPDIASLWGIFEKWLAAFPFHITYFTKLKSGFEKSFFALLLKNRKDNRYTGMFSARARTQPELLEILNDVTKELLTKIDAAALLEKGQITDTKKHTLELKKADLKIKNDLLLGKYLSGEIEYLNILKEWLSYQKDFFRDIALFISDVPETNTEDQTPETLRVKHLKAEFERMGFCNLPLIKDRFSDANLDRFFQLLSAKKAPYQIAMLNHIGVLEFLFKKNTKEQSYKILAEILKAKIRVVKGNCLVLSDQSNEDRKIYTSFMHKKEAEKDYKNLKSG